MSPPADNPAADNPAAADAARLREVIAGAAPDADPARRVAAVRAYFDGLDPAAAQRLAHSEPDLVGNLDGAPFPLRYEANRIRMGADRDALGNLLTAGVISPDEYERYETLSQMLDTRTVERIDPATGRVRSEVQERTFAAYGVGEGGAARAVEVIGDLPAASQVAVWVPGFLINIDRFEGQVAGVNRIRDAAGPDRTAGIVWLGYDIPQVSKALDVLSDRPAVAGGERLASFDAALDRETAPDARVTLLAHSYGSVVAGEALRRGARFDNVVITGSPGMGRDVDSREALGVPEGRLFTMGTRDDLVRFSEWHGPDPVGFPDALRLETGSVRGHGNLTGYLRPGSEALANIGRVVRSDYAALTFTDGSYRGDAWWAESFQTGAHAMRKLYDGIEKVGEFLGGVRDTVVGRRSDRYAPCDGPSTDATGVISDGAAPRLDRYAPGGLRPGETAGVGGQGLDRYAPSDARETGTGGELGGVRPAAATPRTDGRVEKPPGGGHTRA